MKVEADTTLDGVRLRVGNLGVGRWFLAGHSSIFVGSGTFCLVIAAGALISMNVAGLFIAAVAGFIGAVHFGLGSTGVLRALREVQLECSAHEVEVRWSLGGLVPYAKREIPLRGVKAVADGTSLRLETPTGDYTIPWSTDHTALSDVVDMLNLAALDASSDGDRTLVPAQLLAMVSAS